MPIDAITYSAFVEMFEPSKDFSGYDDDGTIQIEWEAVPCKNPAREANDWYAFLWKPASEVYTGRRMRVEYKGSSNFAFWWNDITDWNEEEEDEKCCKCNAAFTYDDNLQKGFNLETGGDRMCEKCYNQEEKN